MVSSTKNKYWKNISPKSKRKRLVYLLKSNLHIFDEAKKLGNHKELFKLKEKLFDKNVIRDYLESTSKELYDTIREEIIKVINHSKYDYSDVAFHLRYFEYKKPSEPVEVIQLNVYHNTKFYNSLNVYEKNYADSFR